MTQFSVSGIYKITSPSGAVYIGQSNNIQKRIYQYKCNKAKEQPYLSNSFNKYGFSLHEFEVIHKMNDNYTQLQMDYAELYMWRICVLHGNVTLNSQEPFGSHGKHSEEARRKISAAKTGNTYTRGTKKTEEAKRLIALGATGNKNWLGKYHSEQTKAKMRKPKSESHRLKINLACDVRRKKIIDINTNIIYDSIIDAAKNNNLSWKALASSLQRRTNKSRKHLNFNYL